MEAHSRDYTRAPVRSPLLDMASRSASLDRRTRSEESWVEISSQPSSSSLSSVADEIITTGLRVQHDPHSRRRRAQVPSNLSITRRTFSTEGTSSQEEYDESGSESDRIMASSGEQGVLSLHPHMEDMISTPSAIPQEEIPRTSDDDADVDDDDTDENRTAINHPLHSNQIFTPPPNAFSHPPSGGTLRTVSQPSPGSYFPRQQESRRNSRPFSSTARPSLSSPSPRNPSSSHLPHNILSPSYNAAAQHDEALRASLSTLLSCAAAARGLPKVSSTDAAKRPQTSSATPIPRGNRVEPLSFRLIPASPAHPSVPASAPAAHFSPLEPTFKPTIRRESTSTSTSSADHQTHQDSQPHRTSSSTKDHHKRKGSSRERRTNAVKKPRRATSSTTASPEMDFLPSPTLLTWLVSAGVVVFLSALTFSAGYSFGKEAGRLETASGLDGFGGGGGAGSPDFMVRGEEEALRSCAREAGRAGAGLRRSLARSAVQV